MTDPWLVQWEERRKAREAQDRSFEIDGETLTVHATVLPEVSSRYYELGARYTAFVTAFRDAEAAGKEPPLTSGIDDSEMLDISEATIRSCLTPDSLPAWERLRSPDHARALGLFDIYGLANYVLTKVTMLPTAAPAASLNGRTATAASSKGGSRSPGRARKA